MDQDWKLVVHRIVASAMIVAITVALLLGFYVNSPAAFSRWHMAISVLGFMATLGVIASIAFTRKKLD